MPSQATAPSPTVDCLPARPWRRIGCACTVEGGPWRFPGQYRRAAHHLQRLGQQGRRLPAARAHRTIAGRRTLALRRQERARRRVRPRRGRLARSEEHTSELQSLMRISYAVFCLKKKNTTTTHTYSKKYDDDQY